VRLDLKDEAGRQQLEQRLERSDLLVTSSRPAALQRLGLSWEVIHPRYPRLCQVAIVGQPSPHADRPGHDLTYMAQAGLLDPPRMPRTCLADLAGAQQAVSTALALLLGRERGQEARYAEVSLAAAADDFAAPWRYAVTAPAGILGGACPGYGLYLTRAGWVALAALEPHFWEKLTRELGLTTPDRWQLEQVFLTRTADEWEAWAAARDVPLAAVRESAAFAVADARAGCDNRATNASSRGPSEAK
jgi:crotonobetainyl-CoA:carnitine CoA-transferase CaiB-like acyl-CoA transferase